MLFAVVCAGVAGTLVAWTVMRPVMRSAPLRLAQDIPAGGGWRLCWPWISALSALCGPLLSWQQRDRLKRLVYRANLPAVITPAHLVASMVSVAMLGAGVGAGLGVVVGARNAWAWSVIAGAFLAMALQMTRLRARVCRRRNQIDRELPFVLDMMTLCVESGLGLHSALQQAVQHGPPGPLRDELIHALSTMRAGVPRVTALKLLAERSNSPAVRQWIAALIHADSLGMSLGLLLREHAAQCRADRLLRAEKLAMEAPVKMLLPLIGCIFPCTFIVLAFPIVMQMWGDAR